MRLLGLSGSITVLFLCFLTRCGEPTLPAAVPALTVTKQNNAPRGDRALTSELQPVTESTLAPTPPLSPTPQPPTVERVRQLVRSLGTPGCGCGRVVGGEPSYVTELKAIGEIAFPAYEFILADPGSAWEEVWGTCDIIAQSQGDRRRFAPLAVQRLAAADALVPGDATFDDTRRLVRIPLIYLLMDVGDERDAAVLVRVLREHDRELHRHAVEALATIGGQRELEALNAWLAVQNPNDPRLPKFRKYRDEFEARLKVRPSRRTF